MAKKETAEQRVQRAQAEVKNATPGDRDAARHLDLTQVILDKKNNPLSGLCKFLRSSSGLRQYVENGVGNFGW
ncbi:MAG: hypothetical protein ACREN8_11180 [Candidatus Dormibacteraceae bacterium]